MSEIASEIVERPAPVTVTERIHVLDILRGIAILGILIMNIQFFAMIHAAYSNPMAYGDLTGINKWVFILGSIFARTKFLNIFSMMFGAGVVLMTSKIEKRGLRAAAVHYRRTLILLMIGLIHAFLLWSGDILTWYALCGLIIYPFRRVRPKRLIITGTIFIVIPFLLIIGAKISMPYWPEESVKEMAVGWTPSPEEINEEVTAYRGGWLDQMSKRAPLSLMMNTLIFLMFGVWRTCGMMMIGMALFKTGVLSGLRSRRFYITFVLTGIFLGFPLEILGLYKNFADGWTLEYSMLTGTLYTYWAGILISFAYIGIIMLIFTVRGSGALTRALASVGRMALSNYLGQTIICTTIFYGHGFGLFGSVDRAGQILIVFAIWIVQLIVSPIWLNHFRFGPFEWLWRSLTYKKPQPMRNKTQVEA